MSDGKPYAPLRYKEIVKERYLISKYIHTSYLDVGDITPAEKNYLVEFIYDELKTQKQMLDEKTKK